MLYNLYKILFENIEETIPHFLDEWIPTNLDWNNMILNMNNHASLGNIFNKISTIEKIIRCYLVAKALNWPKINDYFDSHIRKKLKGWLLYDEIELVNNENIKIPEDYLELIKDLEEFDPLGGIALRNQDIGEFSDDIALFNALKKLKHLKCCNFSKMPLDYGNYHPNIRIIKLTFNNGSIAYIKVERWSGSNHSFKCLETSTTQIDKWRLQSLMQIYMAPYENDVKTDPENTPNLL